VLYLQTCLRNGSDKGRRKKSEETSALIKSIGRDLQILGECGNKQATLSYLSALLSAGRSQHPKMSPKESKQEFLEAIHKVARWTDLGVGNVVTGKRLALGRSFGPLEVVGSAGDMIRKVTPNLQ